MKRIDAIGFEFAKKEAIEALREGVAIVTFEKKDGSIRELRGTLRNDLLPPVPEPVEGAALKKEKKLSEEVVNAFDLEKQEWRSFRVDSIISVKKGE